MTYASVKPSDATNERSLLATMSDVVLENVSRHFGDVTAVDRVDLEVINNEFMVLLGPSGCGKTTLLRIVAGLETVSDGVVHIGGKVVTDTPAGDRDVSMVFQSYALYPHMTVARNIESPLAARKVPREQRQTRVTEVAGLLGINDLLDRKPGALSGGQRQRVALARAIVSQPAVHLMDEPLSNLDATMRARTRVELVDLHARLNTTFIYVTHDQVEAMTMATRIAVMSEGTLQQVGPPQAVYDYPHNLFVARFIGSPPMNTINARFVIEAGEAFVQFTSGRFRVAPVINEAVADGTRVIVGIRPEHLTIGDGPVEVSVRTVEWLGHERHVICELDDVELIVREPASGQCPKPGERVRLSADPRRVHLFNPETTIRLR